MDCIEACYRFAGITGFSPHEYTLRELFAMACGKAFQKRVELLQLVNLVWSIDQVDKEQFLLCGSLASTGKGGPVQLDENIQARIDAEVDRIRAENPNLPRFVSES